MGEIDSLLLLQLFDRQCDELAIGMQLNTSGDSRHIFDYSDIPFPSTSRHHHLSVYSAIWSPTGNIVDRLRDSSTTEAITCCGFSDRFAFRSWSEISRVDDEHSTIFSILSIVQEGVHRAIDVQHTSLSWDSLGDDYCQLVLS